MSRDELYNPALREGMGVSFKTIQNKIIFGLLEVDSKIILCVGLNLNTAVWIAQVFEFKEVC